MVFGDPEPISPRTLYYGGPEALAEEGIGGALDLGGRHAAMRGRRTFHAESSAFSAATPQTQPQLID